MSGMTFTVKTETFEGPLDVLLNLIEKRKLLINEISLSSVADDFIAYVKSHDEFPVSQAAHFILVASTLLLIKSKSLLPTLELTEEEQSDVEDLKLRLSLHQLHRTQGEVLRAQFGTMMLHFPERDRKREVVFSPDETTTLPALTEAIRRVLLNLPKKSEKLVSATVRKVMSLEEMIDRLSSRIQSAVRMRFAEFSGMGKAERVEVIVSFLAMLELVKQGVIKVAQEGHFSDIVMEHDRVATPRYG